MSSGRAFRLSILTVSPSAGRALESALRSEALRSLASDVELRIEYIGSEGASDPKDLEAALTADMLFLDLMGADKAFQERLPTLAAKAKPVQVVVLNTDTSALRTLTRLGSFSMAGMGGGSRGTAGRMGGTGGKGEALRKGQAEQEGGIQEANGEKMLAMARMLEKAGKALPVGPLEDGRNVIWFGSYWRNAVQRNMVSFLCLAVGRYGKKKGWPKAQAPEQAVSPALYDGPGGRIFSSMADLDQALGCDALGSEGGRIGLLFSAGTYPVDTHGAVGELLRTFRAQFAVYPVAVASGDAKTMDTLRGLFLDAETGKASIDCLVNLNAFRLAQGPMGGDAAAGERLLAELDVPYLHPFAISKRDRDTWLADARGLQSGEFMLHYFLPELDGAARTPPIAAAGPDGSLEPLKERLRTLAGRIAALVRLRRSRPRDRRIAVVLYDYPPGEASAGAAAFLDSFGSAAALLGALAEAGYDTEALSPEELRSRLVGGGHCSPDGLGAGLRIGVDSDEYAALLGDGTEGRALGSRIDHAWGRFPGSVNRDGARVLIPGIAVGSVLIAFQPPRVDAAAVDAARYHDPYLPPHHQYMAFYRYLERSFGAHAIVHIGTHGTLEFLPGKELAPSAGCFPDGLIGTLPHFYYYYSGNPAEAMIAKRKAHAVMVGYLQPPYGAAGLSPELAALARLREEHAQAAVAAPERTGDIEQDIRERMAAMGWEWRGPDALDAELNAIKTSLIPLGHHCLGRPYAKGEALDFLKELLKGEAEGYPPLCRTSAAEEGFDYSAMLADPAAHRESWKILDARVGQALEQGLEAASGRFGAIGGDKAAGSDEAWTACVRIYNQLTQDAEIPALLRCLDGGFIPSGLAGDPYRSPEVIPTGRNLHQFDPRRAPTPSALRRGREVADNTLKEYYARNGGYPAQVAVVLWGLEASKTEGETVAQIFSYLGVRLRPGRSLWDSALELIPREELGRPRVDVSVQISGFFRDLFPNLMDLINDGVALAADAEDEADNTVAAHVAELASTLRGKGVKEEDALDRAKARIFGPPPGSYGTGITTMVNDGRWSAEEDIASRYREAMGHAYTKRRYGEADREALDANLARVRLVSQIRPSRDYEITDLDHYYEHFGGLAKSVELVSGTKAALMVSDSLEGRVRTEGADSAIRRGLHGRLLNPRWQDGVLATALRGGQEIADRLENMVGLAAGTGAVPSEAFHKAAEVFIMDEEMRDRLKSNNPHALRDSIERLFEAAGRGYWQAEQSLLEELRRIYLELEGDLE